MLISRIAGFLSGLLLLGLLPGVASAAGSSEMIGKMSYSAALIDQAATLSDEPGGIRLMGARPMALSLEAGNEEEFRDWDGLKEDTFYFAFTQMVVIGVLYVSPQNISGWTTEKKDEYSFTKWKANIRSVVWDTDKWWINYTLHPYWGGAYYVRAAERGYGPVPSFWYSVTLSTIYEFGAEALFEKPSIQDLIFTPGLGFFVGRYFMSVREGIKYREMNGETLSGTDRAKLFFTDPLGAVNRKINSVLGRQASFTLTPAVMVVEREASPDADNSFTGAQTGDLFTGLRLHLTW